MSFKNLEPIEIIRSEMGTWTHPAFSEYMNENLKNEEYVSSDEWKKFKNHFDVDTVTFWMESSVSPDDWEIMMDDSDITKWEPIAPNGFFLIDINFSEDDAYAIFARNKRECEVA
ncbi:hypothetical protein [Acinetobacter radioresistens]|uniref:hypothetical protein n=2 Tax=Acinetobacter radioresistens TaxID=40216 RepID=UPI0021CD65A2|nr:hypothetical protein [Acinetobacter radioresistens]MCU4309532.1 hypothetical protein [Acinetobacter radioresistens]MCU4568543.1 hypothetical protein [Acinetobacter radioresistens]